MISIQTIKDLLVNAGYEPRSYSGRGMYGRQCIAVETGASQPAVKVTLQVIHAALTTEKAFKDDEDITMLLESLDDVRTDNMGRDWVVYWPSIKWED